MKLELTFFKHVKMLLTLIIVSLLFSVFILYFYDSFSLKTLVCIQIPFFLIYVFPVLYIHCNYYKFSKGIVYEISKLGLTVKTKNGNKEININQIKEIIIFMTTNRIKNSGYSEFPFDCYYYAKIRFNDNEELIISSLFSHKLDKILESNLDMVKITKIKVFYPTISGNN